MADEDHVAFLPDNATRTCGRNSTADSDVEFVSNLISKIEFDTAEMRHMNQANLLGNRMAKLERE